MSAPGLPPTLETLLGQLPDRAFSPRLRKVYVAAAQAISRLSDLDLLKYESASLEGAPDLSLWEEMAPIIRDTVVDVNALLMVMRQEFAEGTRAPPTLTLDGRRQREAEQAIHEAAHNLAQHVTLLGERMRSPSVVADRWNLLADIQSFRTRFREDIGELVFRTASAFTEVHRKDVVPSYAEDEAAALAVRATAADLLRVVNARSERINEATAEDLQWNAHQAEKELDTFGRTPAYRALRAQDKRVVIEFRHELGTLARRTSIAKKDLVAVFEPFAQFVRDLGEVNKREVLVAHDREVTAACSVLLEKAHGLVGSRPPDAARLLAQAAANAQRLYGRDPALDSFLRRARKTPLERLPANEVGPALARFSELLAALPLF